MSVPNLICRVVIFLKYTMKNFQDKLNAFIFSLVAHVSQFPYYLENFCAAVIQVFDCICVSFANLIYEL